MWNAQTPFFPSQFPFSGYQWSSYAPPYPIPETPHNSEQIAEKKESAPKLESLRPERQQKEAERALETIASRISRKAAEIPVIKRKIFVAQFSKKEDSFDKKRQKKDRNLPSNTCRYFITFFFQHSSPEKVLGAWNPASAEVYQRCMKQVREHIQMNQIYIRPSIIEKMCQGQLLGPAESAFFRLFFKRFIKVEFRMIIAMMKKLRKKEKLAYFKLGNKFLRHFVTRP